jgi:hypothetical protein
MTELQLYLVGGAAAAAVAAIAGVVWWLNRRPAVPIVRQGVLHELLLAAPIRLWALILAGPPLTGLAAWLVYLVRYGWPTGTEVQRLEILGWALFGVLGLVAIIVVGLALVRLEAETRLGKFSIGADDNDDDRAGELPLKDRVG